MQRFAQGEAFDARPMPELDSDAIDFRVASESFAPIRRLGPDLPHSSPWGWCGKLVSVRRIRTAATFRPKANDQACGSSPQTSVKYSVRSSSNGLTGSRSRITVVLGR